MPAFDFNLGVASVSRSSSHSDLSASAKEFVPTFEGTLPPGLPLLVDDEPAQGLKRPQLGRSLSYDFGMKNQYPGFAQFGQAPSAPTPSAPIGVSLRAAQVAQQQLDALLSIPMPANFEELSNLNLQQLVTVVAAAMPPQTHSYTHGQALHATSLRASGQVFAQPAMEEDLCAKALRESAAFEKELTMSPRRTPSSLELWTDFPPSSSHKKLLSPSQKQLSAPTSPLTLETSSSCQKRPSRVSLAVPRARSLNTITELYPVLQEARDCIFSRSSSDYETSDSGSDGEHL